MTFGEKLKIARKNKNISQDELASKMGINRVAVSNYEQDKNEPTFANVKKIISILDLPDDYFVSNKTSNIKTIPLIGLASCGIPNIAYNDIIEYIPVPADIAHDGVYAVVADGDSMLPKISNGDIVICDKNMECENGNIVHYTTIDGDSGLKKYLIDNNGVVTLMPLNSDFKPIVCDVNDLRCARAFKIQSNL